MLCRSALYLQFSKCDVKVESAKENIIIKTTIGNITVQNYEKSGKFTSEKGKIVVKNNSEYLYFSWFENCLPVWGWRVW